MSPATRPASPRPRLVAPRARSFDTPRTDTRRNFLKSVGALALAAGLGYGRGAPGQAAATERLAYYSDYFSFVGADARGRVALALDNNRGQDGDAFQAEHFLVLHDERTGWVEIEGNGFYPNAGALERIPDSTFFQFSGTPDTGLRVTSERNRLALEIAPIPRALVRQRGDGLFWLGSAPGRLQWQGRALEGRVIFEYLARQGWNRLTRTYFGQWRDFHALYLAVEGGGDLYVHSQAPGEEEPLSGTLVGFAVLEGQGEVLEALALNAPDSTQALGFYRWPSAWRGTFSLRGRQHEFSVTLGERKGIANWVIGGFSMGIAQGELRRGTERRALYGLAELII